MEFILVERLESCKLGIFFEKSVVEGINLIILSMSFFDFDNDFTLNAKIKNVVWLWLTAG